MADWKSALAALGAMEEPNDNKERTEIDRKKRIGVVYSTNPDYEYSDDSQEEADTLPKNQQKLRLNMERAGRGGKTVTLIKGFIGSEEDITALCKLLKQKCGVGGSVKDGELISSGHNHVLSNMDPTCHGEVDAIRKACQKLGTHDLSGCELYTTGEPCHMCLCACMWANISKIYYGCTIEDNGLIGFRDDKFDQIFGGRDKLEGYMTEMDREACLELFEEYKNLYHKLY